MDQRECINFICELCCSIFVFFSLSAYRFQTTGIYKSILYQFPFPMFFKMFFKSWTSWHQKDGSKHPHNRCKNWAVLWCVFVLLVIRWSFKGKRCSSRPGWLNWAVITKGDIVIVCGWGFKEKYNLNGTMASKNDKLFPCTFFCYQNFSIITHPCKRNSKLDVLKGYIYYLTCYN